MAGAGSGPNDEYGRWLFGLAFASSSATIVSGAIAERCKITAYLAFTAVSVGIIYPLASHWCRPPICMLSQLSYPAFRA